MTKFSFVSLGCPKNLVDTEIIALNLVNAGFEFVAEGDEDVIIVNTCSFLKSARDETYSEIAKQLMRKSYGDIDKVFVAGCILRSHYSGLLERFPQIDGVIPFPIDSEGGVLENFIGDLKIDSRILLTQNHTAYLRISYGCDNKCTYCLIPQIRGGYRSRPVDDIIA
jgi:ribosomal protein S12 methylthiotransferase